MQGFFQQRVKIGFLITSKALPNKLVTMFVALIIRRSVCAESFLNRNSTLRLHELQF
jgi:hypothetical protein